MKIRYLGTAIFLGISASGAMAQDRQMPETPRPAIFEALVNCRTVADEGERLACYDRNVTALDEAERKDEIIMADRESIKEAKRGLFGFNLPKLKILGGDDEDSDELTATIDSSRRGSNGEWIIILEDGAKWQQVDGKRLPLSPKPGQNITIKKAALGSYFVKVNGQTAIKMKRVN